MADEIVFDAKVDVGEGAKSLRQLKQDYKDAQKGLDGLTEGTREYVAQLKKLGSIKDEIGDLNSAVKAFNPDAKLQSLTNVVGGLASGFAAAQGAAALFGGESKELERTLVKVQAAMALSQGLNGLQNLKDDLKVLTLQAKEYAVELIGVERVQKIAAVATRLWNAALNANPITVIITAVTALTAGVYLLAKAFSTTKGSVEDLTEQYENLKKANEKLNHEYDNEIKILESLGGQEEKILQLKKNKLIAIQEESKALKVIAEQKLRDAVQETSILEKLFILTGNNAAAQAQKVKAVLEANEEVKKSDQAVEDARVNIEVLDNERERKKAEDAKKASDKAKAEADKQLAEHQKYLDALADQENANADKLDQLQKESHEAYKALQEQIKEQDAKDAEDRFVKSQTEFYAHQELIAEQNATSLQAQLDYLDVQREQELANTELTESQKALIVEQYENKKRDLRLAAVNSELQTATSLSSSLQSLSDAVFAVKSANTKKGSAEDLANAKKQFNINKALGIASATISGIQGVVNALSAQSVVPEPAGTILKVANAVVIGAAAVANIVKISKTKFGDQGGGSASVAAPASPSAPSINAPQNSSTLLNPDGSIQNNQPVKPEPLQVHVLETHITEKQNRVKLIEEQATVR